MSIDKIYQRGYSDIIKFDVKKSLENLQQVIYSLTKELIVDHDTSITLEKKLKLPFKSVPSNKIWSEIMSNVNDSDELKQLIKDDGVVNIFKRYSKNQNYFQFLF